MNKMWWWFCFISYFVVIDNFFVHQLLKDLTRYNMKSITMIRPERNRTRKMSGWLHDQLFFIGWDQLLRVVHWPGHPINSLMPANCFFVSFLFGRIIVTFFYVFVSCLDTFFSCLHEHTETLISSISLQYMRRLCYIFMWRWNIIL